MCSKLSDSRHRVGLKLCGSTDYNRVWEVKGRGYELDDEIEE